MPLLTAGLTMFLWDKIFWHGFRNCMAKQGLKVYKSLKMGTFSRLGRTEFKFH